MNQITIIEVNKYISNWHSKALFSDFSIRVILKDENNYILRIKFVRLLTEKLIEDIGNQFENWILIDRSDVTELYLKC